MNTDDRFKKLLAATPEQLMTIDALLNNEVSHPAPQPDMRLLTFSSAAKELGVSRQTVWRMVREGRLLTKETRANRYRIPAAALAAFVKGEDA